jgi:DNA-binding LytR/AlgR family response regulator
MAQYAIKGYAVDALDFLLKPVPYFAFSQQLKRSLERLKSKESLNLLFPTENGIAKLDAAQILYIESFKHKIIVYTYDKMYSIIGTMREYEQKLASKHFFRCNNGYLVNLDYVKGVEGYTVIVGEYQLIISRPRKKAFMEALADYVGGVIRK